MKSLNHVTMVPPIEARTIIDTAINESYDILQLIPRDVFKNYDWKEIVKSEDDSSHLSPLGYNILGKALDDIISTLI